MTCGRQPMLAAAAQPHSPDSLPDCPPMCTPDTPPHPVYPVSPITIVRHAHACPCRCPGSTRMTSILHILYIRYIKYIRYIHNIYTYTYNHTYICAYHTETRTHMPMQVSGLNKDDEHTANYTYTYIYTYICSYHAETRTHVPMQVSGLNKDDDAGWEDLAGGGEGPARSRDDAPATPSSHSQGDAAGARPGAKAVGAPTGAQPGRGAKSGALSGAQSDQGGDSAEASGCDSPTARQQAECPATQLSRVVAGLASQDQLHERMKEFRWATFCCRVAARSCERTPWMP